MSEHRSLRALLALSLMASLAGCSSPAESGSAEAPEEKEETQQETETPAEPEKPAASQTSPDDAVYHAGDTITDPTGYVFTITEAGFTDAVSASPDDTFLLPAADGMKTRTDSQLLYYVIEYQYTGSAPKEASMLFHANTALINNGQMVINAMTVFRKAGEDWMLTAAGPDAAIGSIVTNSGVEYVDKYEYQPSDQKYEARGLINIQKDLLADGPLTVLINGYMLEITR